jgi:hypothetical protein
VSTDEGDFLRRWSRRKREAAAVKPAAGKALEAKAADLPPVESLTFDSDFAQFLRANVEESVKRAALKKLLRDPRFNVMDGLDVYIDDYSKDDPIPPEMLKNLEHARTTLFGPRKQDEKAAAEGEGQAEPAAPVEDAKAQPEKKDGDTGQDA